jgi:squalene-associated FAD-dependent desaturase
VGTTHVIGAGLAGLAAALSLVEAGRRVVIHEAGPAAGGRCRSYFDRGLAMRIDNGNHLILSGNGATMAFLDQIGTRHTLGGPGVAAYPFVDLGSGERWTVTPGRGRIPWWLLDPTRRVAGTRARDFLSLLPLLRARGDATVASVLRRGPLYHRLLEPLAVAALNTRPERGLAVLLARVMRETLLRGGGACVPSFPRSGLSESFVDPAIAWLRQRGAEVRLGRRITALRREGDRVTALETTEQAVVLSPACAVVLATPAWVAADLLPGLRAPDEHESILNVHFRSEAPPAADFAQAGFIGLIGGTAEWLFAKPGVLSVTISAAAALADDPAEDIARRVWPEARLASGLPAGMAMPATRVVKERRATFAATAEQERRRPGARIGLVNLALAGDWTATGLPATIEGAIRSGRTAAAALLA